MDLLLSQEQSQVVDAITAFLGAEHAVAQVQTAATGSLATLDRWRKLGELGWLGLGLEERYGGAGFALIEEILLAMEAAKYLVSPALLGSLLGARLAAQCGDDALAQAIVGGEKIVAPAIPSGNSQEIFILEARHAEFALLIGNDNASLIRVSALTLESQTCVDQKLQLANAQLSTEAAIYQIEDSDLLARARILCAAYLTGLAQSMQAQAVAYAKEREQFGKPIGSFQAIKHKCADMAVRCEAAHAMTLQAGLHLQDKSADAQFDVLSARVLAQDAAVQNAAECIHIHGGMGFTEEMPIHWFFKRAQVVSQLFSDKHALLDQLANIKSP